MPVWAVWCPRGDQCSRGGRVLARGANADDLRARLLQHLAAAPGHSDMPEDERAELARTAQVSRWDSGTDEDAAGALPIGAKRRRRDGGDAWSHAPGSASDATAPTEVSSGDILSDISAAVALGIQEGVATALMPQQMPQQQASQAVLQGSVVLPSALVSSVVDHLMRAEQASRQAGRISATAANAFDAEANAIASARLNIEAMLQRQRY